MGKNMLQPLCMVSGTVLVRGTCAHSPALSDCLTRQVPWSVSAHSSPDHPFLGCPCPFLAFSALPTTAGGSPPDPTCVTQQIILGQTQSWACPKVWHVVKCFIHSPFVKSLLDCHYFDLASHHCRIME